jgi:hypothetical protein
VIGHHQELVKQNKKYFFIFPKVRNVMEYSSIYDRLKQLSESSMQCVQSHYCQRRAQCYG